MSRGAYYLIHFPFQILKESFTNQFKINKKPWNPWVPGPPSPGPGAAPAAGRGGPSAPGPGAAPCRARAPGPHPPEGTNHSTTHYTTIYY